MKNKHPILLLVSLIIFFASCRKDENIVPDFSYEVVQESKEGVSIKFTNLTSMTGTPRSYLWEFGDNSTIGDNNYIKSPSHQFEMGGTIYVTLIVEGKKTSERITKPIIIPGMVADFDAVIHDLNIVTITNNSSNYGGVNTKFFWDMGDGEIITTQDFVFDYAYSEAGDYKINLRIERGNERALAAKSVIVSDFTVNFLIHEISLNKIEIEDKTENVFGEETALHIDYGDGTVYDAVYTFLPERIPKQYDKSGNYQITYTITRGSEKGTAIKTIAISDFLVDFNFNSTSQINVFELTDNTSDLFGDYEITVDFGDGDNITFDNNSYTTHTKTYEHAGNYLINYNITRGSDVGYANKSVYIPGLVAKFNVYQGSAITVFDISDASLNLFGTEEVSVDFGDGSDLVTFVTTSYPTYEKTYTSGGSYNITYNVNRGNETSSTVKTVNIENFIADFTVVNGANNNIFNIADASSNLSGSETVTIDFGDGTELVEYSSTSYPQHIKTYANSGNYNIVYTVSRGIETDTKIKTVSIASPTANLTIETGSEINIFNISDASTNLVGDETVTIDFGDGNVPVEYSTTSYTTHQKTYANGGTYNVAYTISRSGESDTKIKTISVGNLTADFTLPTGSEINIFDITDNSSNLTGTETVIIDFGDGESPVEYPTTSYTAHEKTYANGGSYNISYTIAGSSGTDNETKTISLPGLYADFVIDDSNSPTFDFTVTDQQPFGTITYEWDFGDGNTSADKDVSHTYSGYGSFSVILTLRRGAEFSQMTKTVYIQAPVAPMNPQFTYTPVSPLLIQGETIEFINESTHIPGSANLEWIITPGTDGTDFDITTNDDNIEVLFKVAQEYDIKLEYTDGLDIETSSTTTLDFAALTADFDKTSDTWDGGNLTTDIVFDFTTTNPIDTDGATFSWTLNDNVPAEITTGTGLSFSVLDLPEGNNYNVIVERTFGGITVSEQRAFSIDVAGVFTWD